MSEPTMTHRARAAEDLGADLVVTAGAGAGKTTVLVDRFVRIARNPALGPERVLAITFTRKAAVEMKERVIRVLENAGEVSLRRRAEAAYISTIHGFAERILRERAFDAELDPAFELLTEHEQAAFFDDARDAMRARADLRQLAPRLGKTEDGGWVVFSLVEDVARLHREGSLAARSEASVFEREGEILAMARARSESHVQGERERMLACIRALEPLLADAPFRSQKTLYESSRAYLAALRACMAQQSPCVVDRAIWSETRFTAEIRDPSHREPIRALLADIKRMAPVAAFDDWATEEARERELLPLKRAIYAAAAAMNESYVEYKRRRGALDFHDLQERAARLLHTRTDIRREYADRFAHILLDESQDTDELQYGLVQSLRTPDNTLFMVGDPKQAIYEFRGANPDVFAQALTQIRAEDRLQLAENFRSRPEIVAFVNSIGPALLPDQFVPIDARASYAERPLTEPAITALYAIQQPQPNGNRKEPISDVRPREAAALAEEIVALLRARPLVRDPNARDVSWVSLRPRHIALLFRTRTAIPYFEHALAQRGVPYVTAAGQGFYERAEVLDCMMLLRAVSQPLDDLALASVLRSPFVGATDADLWRLHELQHQGARVTALAAALHRYAPLAEFDAAFRALRKRTRGLPATMVLEDAIRSFGYEMALAAHEDGPAMLANLAKVRRQVRDMGVVSPREAVTALSRARDLMDREAMAALVGPSDDVVVLTTIHQAKGLEWPIVCLPNAQAAPQGRAVQFSGRHGVLLCHALDEDGEKVEPFSVRSIREEAKQRGEAEERRLLYVALTRARERIILSASVPADVVTAPGAEAKPGYRAPLAFLLASTRGALMSGGSAGDAWTTDVRLIDAGTLPTTRLESGVSVAETITMGAPVSVRPEPAIAAAPPTSVKVTELLAYRRCAQVYRFAHVLEVHENLPRRAALRGDERSAVSPVELGTIVHGLLERARFDASDTRTEAARLIANQDMALHGRLEQLLLPVLDGELGDAVRGAKRVEREWPFAFELGGVLVEGVIDLAIQATDGTWTVYDYKSNDFSRTGRLEYLVDYYTPQLEVYALALSRAGLGDVTGCALVFLSPFRMQRWAFDPATSTRADWAARTIARISAGDYAATVGPQCEQCGYRKRKICSVGRAWTPDIGLPAPGSLRQSTAS